MRDRPEHNRCKSIATRFFSQVEPPPRFIRKLKEPPLNRTNIFFGESHSDWLPVRGGESGNDSNLLIVFYVQIMPDDFVMQLHRF
ncbi:hypothetical protein EWD88_23790 [Salmonella enterica subsp. enterica serovar Agona]|nr:hypothetical protein [Salmonella enterica subsp. enterica serovar Agona]EBR3166606.1 hypothetical protein [Salmonella enterica]EBS0625786.1 hypothetical protein [Salmonella enterica subsp. enterica serovar Agona]ECB3384273.1 hypothetical protein [Salmonella enterica subsp. enterica serovar Agona]ECD1661893.1 hypothetical protein [Salmonella enterica subsp. enterica serovar Agona]